MKPMRIRKIVATEKPNYDKWIEHLKNYQVKIGNLKIYKL